MSLKLIVVGGRVSESSCSIARRAMVSQAASSSDLTLRLTSAPKPKETPFSTFDVAKAKALLAEAGFPRGFSAGIMHRTDRIEDAAQAAVIQSQFAAVGMTVTIDALAGGEDRSQCARRQHALQWLFRTLEIV